MENLQDMIQHTIQQIDDVVELFYQQKVQEAYTKMEPLTQEILLTIDEIFRYRTEHPELAVDEAAMTDALKEVVSAMEEKDSILVADVLKYEVIEKFEDIVGQL